MMHRTALMFFVSLLLTACDSYEEYFLNGSFTQTKPGCHTLSGMSGKSVRFCYPEQINITDAMYSTFLGKRERYVALIVNDEKGSSATVWVSESKLQGIGRVTINLRTEKTTWGNFLNIAPYLFYIAATIAILIFLNSFIKSKAFRLNLSGGVLGILAAIGTWLLVNVVQEIIYSSNFINMVFVIFIGPFLGWLVFIVVNGYFSDLSGKLCPKCGSTDTEKYGSSSYDYEGTETKTRRFTHFNKNHEESGYSEEEYEVPATFTHTIHLMRCKTCKHEWET